MTRRPAGLVALVTIAGSCSLMADTEDVTRIEVDPIVRQAIEFYETGEVIENETVQDHAEVACATTTPRTCAVGEYINFTVFNGSTRPVFYRPSCGPPFR